MAVNTDQVVHPELEETYHEQPHHEDITTLNPTTVLAAVRFIRLRKKAHAKIDVEKNVETVETPPSREKKDVSLKNNTVITQQPGRRTSNASVDSVNKVHFKTPQAEEDDDEQTHDIFDIEQEGENEFKPLMKTRFGHTKEEMDMLYMEYRKIRRKEKKAPSYCSKAWLCQSRSPTVKMCICCSTLHPRYCRCCYFVALQ
jgi:hypothetical protein